MIELKALAKRILLEAVDDNITGESAKVAFYFFLSLFPLILVAFALTGLVGGNAAFDWMMNWLARPLPDTAGAYLSSFIRGVTDQSRPGLLSLGILFTLWSASNVFAALADGLNRMYDLRESRGWWKKRLLAIGVLAAGMVLLLGGSVAVLAGPELIGALRLGGVWAVLRWPLAFGLLVLLMWMVYYVLPNRDQKHALRPTLAGAAAGAFLWVLATLFFRLYVTNLGSYTERYGLIGAVIVLLLWMYLTALTILFGGEIAAVLEHHAGKDRGRTRAEGRH